MNTQNSLNATEEDSRGFINIENDIKLLLNSSIKNKGEKLLILLREFEKLGFKISKQYLKNLYEHKNKNSIRSNLSYLLKSLNYKAEVKNNYFKEFVFKKFETIATGFNYSKTYKISLFYQQHNKKRFEFLVINPKEIKQIEQNKQEMLKRQVLSNIKHKPEMLLSFIFGFG